jgi:hypothetical protein
MPNAETVLDVRRAGTAAEVNLPPTYSRNGHWRARCREIWHGGFEPGAAGKGPDHRYLAGGLPVLRLILDHRGLLRVPTSAYGPVEFVDPAAAGRPGPGRVRRARYRPPGQTRRPLLLPGGWLHHRHHRQVVHAVPVGGAVFWNSTPAANGAPRMFLDLGQLYLMLARGPVASWACRRGGAGRCAPAPRRRLVAPRRGRGRVVGPWAGARRANRLPSCACLTDCWNATSRPNPAVAATWVGESAVEMRIHRDAERLASPGRCVDHLRYTRHRGGADDRASEAPCRCRRRRLGADVGLARGPLRGHIPPARRLPAIIRTQRRGDLARPASGRIAPRLAGSTWGGAAGRGGDDRLHWGPPPYRRLARGTHGADGATRRRARLPRCGRPAHRTPTTPTFSAIHRMPGAQRWRRQLSWWLMRRGSSRAAGRCGRDVAAAAGPSRRRPVRPSPCRTGRGRCSTSRAAWRAPRPTLAILCRAQDPQRREIAVG